MKSGEKFTKVRPLQALVISPSGRLLLFAELLYAGAVDVRYYSLPGSGQYDGDETFEFVKSWRPHLRWADFIVTDSRIVLHKGTAAKFGHKFLYIGRAMQMPGLGSVMVLEEELPEKSPWWKFWRRG